MKRLFDIFLAIAILIGFLPFGVVIALILKLTGDGEIFYVQNRVGKGLATFPMFKFSSMRSDAGVPGGGALTIRNDPRVFPFGRFLRLTKLNEIPQLLNVLRGEMGFVGPRPMLPREQAYMPDDVNRRVYSVTPGVTGIASIVFRDEEEILSASPKGVEACYREDIAPLKAQLDLWYADHRSFVVDLKILFLTAWVILRPSSTAYDAILGSDWPALKDQLDKLRASAEVEARGQGSEVRGQRSEVRGQRSEVRGQRSEVSF